MAESTVAGKGAKGVPLVLLPGLICDAALWEHQKRHLGEIADIHVPDLTGFDTMGELADGVLSCAPPRFALAGLSMGGYVALEIMRRAPERVDRLALLDTNANADPPDSIRRRRVMMDLVGRGRYDEVLSLMYPGMVHPDRVGDEELAGLFRAMAERVGPGAFLRQQAAIIGRPDSRPGLPDIGCPTLVLCGRQDTLSDVAVHAGMASTIPGAKLAVVEDCGHLSAVERPQAVTALMRQWLLYG